MGRVWKPVRLFEEKDGKRRPGAILWMFVGLAVIGAWAGGTLVVRDVRQSRAAAAYLTKTVTPTASETPEPGITPTASETPVPSPTPIPPTEAPYVYDDPGTWELVQATDIAGNEYLDMQDWQKEQVLHAFTEYYNLAWRSMDGAPGMDEVLKYFTEIEYQVYRDEFYPEAIRRNQYLTFPALSDLFLTISYCEDESRSKGGFRLILLLTDLENWVSHYRNFKTGKIESESNMGPRTFEYRIVYKDGGWKVYLEDIHKIAGNVY
ncbi:MAG: hypothetical protein JXA25_19210 [Anaerolineales bacterium]|nr:hypothetical protein [Anaerolineales bacterium]